MLTVSPFRSLPTSRTNETLSFPQFLEHVVIPGIPNSHWWPYHKICHPCHARYSAIGHLETIDDDIKYILTISGLHKYTSHVEWRHMTKNGSTDIWRGKYYSQVPCWMLSDLYNYYEIDFELFGYDPTEYFNLCREIERQSF